MKKLLKKISLPLLSGLLLVTSLVGCTPSSAEAKVEENMAEPLRRTEFMLGTVVTLSLYDHQSEALLDEAFALISSLEDTLSINKSNTLLDEVNNQSGIAPVKVDDNTYDVIAKGLVYSELTGGTFDITVGPLVKLWSIGFPDAKVPTESEITNVLPLIDYQKIILDETAQTIYLTHPGMQIDLGGIGKGYAADRVADLFKANGVEHALIDLGGNIYALGNKPNGSLWKVGVQNPSNPRGEIIGHISIANQSVVTSGIYERFIEQDGKKYHHILNPETGYPFENDIAGVTIISDTSIDGDALSTSVFSQGVTEGLSFVNSLEGVDAIFITKDNKVYLSDHIKDYFVLTDETFEIAN